jgi:hypothetical protein
VRKTSSVLAAVADVAWGTMSDYAALCLYQQLC